MENRRLKILIILILLNLDISSIEPTVAGPKRPQDKILLKNFKTKFIDLLDQTYGRKYSRPEKQLTRWFAEGGGQPVDTDRNCQCLQKLKLKKR